MVWLSVLYVCSDDVDSILLLKRKSDGSVSLEQIGKLPRKVASGSVAAVGNMLRVVSGSDCWEVKLPEFIVGKCSLFEV